MTRQRDHTQYSICLFLLDHRVDWCYLKDYLRNILDAEPGYVEVYSGGEAQTKITGREAAGKAYRHLCNTFGSSIRLDVCWFELVEGGPTHTPSPIRIASNFDLNDTTRNATRKAIQHSRLMLEHLTRPAGLMAGSRCPSPLMEFIPPHAQTASALSSSTIAHDAHLIPHWIPPCNGDSASTFQRIFIGNLNPTVTYDRLKALLGGSHQLKLQKKQLRRGLYATACFSSFEAASAVVDVLDGVELDGWPLRVRFDKDTTPNSSSLRVSATMEEIIRSESSASYDSDSSVADTSTSNLSLQSRASSSGPVIVNGSTAGIVKHHRSASSISDEGLSSKRDGFRLLKTDCA